MVPEVIGRRGRLPFILFGGDSVTDAVQRAGSGLGVARREVRQDTSSRVADHGAEFGPLGFENEDDWLWQLGFEFRPKLGNVAPAEKPPRLILCPSCERHGAIVLGRDEHRLGQCSGVHPEPGGTMQSWRRLRRRSGT